MHKVDINRERVCAPTLDQNLFSKQIFYARPKILKRSNENHFFFCPGLDIDTIAPGFRSNRVLQSSRKVKRTTIVTTIQADIVKTKKKFPNFQVNSLSCFQDLIKIRQIASDRKLWHKIIKSVVNTAEAEHQEGLTD